MNKRMKTKIDAGLSEIHISEQLEHRIMALSKTRQKQPMRRAMVVLIACGILLIALPVLAATVPSFQALLVQIGDEIAIYLQPIELEAESDGIRMEVIAAMNDDYNAVVYIALSDIAGERLGGAIDLYDYGLSITNMSIASLAEYDESTQTAILRILAYGGQKLNGQKINFFLRSFLAGRSEHDNVDIDIPLDALTEAKDTVWLSKNDNIGGGGNYDELEKNGGVKLLPINEQKISIPGIDFAYISNIGIVDGRLHVQTCWPLKGHFPANLDDHGEVRLVDSTGKTLQKDEQYFSVSFCTDAQGNIYNTDFNAQGLLIKNGTYYQEQIFEISAELTQSKLHGYFTSNREYITGDWNVTFRIEAAKAFKQADCDIDIGSATIQTITVSPLGWTVLGEKQPFSDTQAELLVKMADGTEERIEILCASNDESSFTFHAFSEELVDVTQIKEVFVNGQKILLLEK